MSAPKFKRRTLVELMAKVSSATALGASVLTSTAVNAQTWKSLCSQSGAAGQWKQLKSKAASAGQWKQLGACGFTFVDTIGPTDAWRYNYNLRARAVAAGWNGTDDLDATVTVLAGTYVSSTSTAVPSFDTGSGFPAGSVLRLFNNGTIAGKGGYGGAGAVLVWNCSGKGGCSLVSWGVGQAGGSGGPALRAQFPLQVTNNGTVGGGGGGGGGGASFSYSVGKGGSTASNGNGGGGGRGADGGPGGAGFVNGGAGSPTSPGAGGYSPAYTTTCYGGNGGQLGQWGASGASDQPGPKPPGAGGAPGSATLGNSNITWLVAGTRLGALN